MPKEQHIQLSRIDLNIPANTPFHQVNGTSAHLGHKHDIFVVAVAVSFYLPDLLHNMNFEREFMVKQATINNNAILSGKQ